MSKHGDVGHPSSPCLDIPKPKLGDVGHPSSPGLDIPKPKLGDVGHPIPHSWTSPSLLPSLGMCVGYGGEGIIWVGSSTKHHFIELERKKPVCWVGITKP